MATLRQLKTFVATAEHKKMSEAAKHLYVSQPTISQIISELEKEYNTTLFERHTKELRITPSGKLLLENAKKIIAIQETLEQSMKTMNAKRPLHIGATLTIGVNIMAKIATQLEAQYPNIDTTVVVNNTDHIQEMLLHHELDIALVEGIISHEDIFTSPVFEDNLCIICGHNHPLAKKKILSPQDLHNQNFILREKGSGTRAIFEHLMLSHHIPYNVKWESNSTAAIIDAVSQGIGLGFVSVRCIQEQARNGFIYICPIQEINLKRFFYICYHQYHPITPQMRDFIDFVRSLPANFQ